MNVLIIAGFYSESEYPGDDLHLGIFACERDFQMRENFHLGKFSNHSIPPKGKFSSQCFLSNASKTLFWEIFLKKCIEMCFILSFSQRRKSLSQAKCFIL